MKHRILISDLEMKDYKYVGFWSFVGASFFLWAPFSFRLGLETTGEVVVFGALCVSTLLFGCLYLSIYKTRSSQIFLICQMGFSPASPAVIFSSGISCLGLTLGLKSAALASFIALLSFLLALREYRMTDWEAIRKKSKKRGNFKKIDDDSYSFKLENITCFIKGYGHSYFPDSLQGRLEFYLTMGTIFFGYMLYSYGNVEDEAFRGRLMAGGVWLIAVGWILRPMLVERMIAIRMMTLKKRGEL